MNSGYGRPKCQCPLCGTFSGHEIKNKYDNGYICEDESCIMIYYGEKV